MREVAGELAEVNRTFSGKKKIEANDGSEEAGWGGEKREEEGSEFQQFVGPSVPKISELERP